MSAIISECGQYRYRLERDVQMDGITFAFFGINPSKADAYLDDATVRKWIGFTKVNDGRRFIVGNISAYRATNVKHLGKILTPPARHWENLGHLSRIVDDADVLVPCWGNRSKAPPHMQNAARRLGSRVTPATSGKGEKMTTAPRVEACIEAVMAKYPRTGPVSQAKYYEEVHQHLGPLARSLERELAQANADVKTLRDILKIIVNERFIPAEWERLTGRIQVALGETK